MPWLPHMWFRYLGVAWLVMVVVLSGLGLEPPAVVSEAAPGTAFSAARAQKWLTRIAQKPHPLGSEEARRVRELLKLELQRLGLHVEEQRAPACTRLGQIKNCAVVVNLVATLRGTEPNKAAVLLSAHYDTVPNSPGAGDDSAGVAALVETARALAAGPRPRHDVIFAFVDGEEALLLGAAALLATPQFRRAFLALNFEARGNRGPSVLIDTSPNNQALIRHVIRGAGSPSFNSLYVALAGVLPNGTDAELYRRHGPKVLSFAMADGLPYYHHGSDTPEALDLRSLQHHGNHALDLARHFGNIAALELTAEADAVFFDLFGLVAVSYPVWLARFMVGLLVVASVVQHRRRRRQLALGRRTAELCAVLGLALAAALGAGFWVWLVTLGWPHWAPYTLSRWLIVAVLLLTVGLGLSLGPWLQRRSRSFRAPALERGARHAWWLFTLLSAAALPTLSHLFFWPLSGALAARALVRSPRPLLAAAASFALAPAALGLSLLVHASLITFGSYAASIAALCLVLGGLLVPQSALKLGASPKTLARGALAAGFALALGLLVAARQLAFPPQGSALFYVTLPTEGRGYWASPDAEPLAWHQAYFQGKAVRGRWPELPSELPLWLAPHQSLELPAPTLRVLADRTRPGARHVTLEVRSPRGARSLSLVEQSGAKVLDFRFEGVSWRDISRVSPEVDAEFMRRVAGIDHGGRFTLGLAALPPAGARLEFVTEPGQRLVFRVADKSEGHPPGIPKIPRPSSLTEGYPGDQTWVLGAPLVID